MPFFAILYLKASRRAPSQKALTKFLFKIICDLQNNKAHPQMKVTDKDICSLRTYGQEMGQLGQYEYTQNIYPRIIFASLSPKEAEAPSLQVVLDNGFVFNLEGEQTELDEEFARIMSERKEELVDLSELSFSVNKWAVDPKHVKDVKSSGGQGTEISSRTWIVLRYSDENQQNVFLARNRNVRDRFYNHFYGGSEFCREIATALNLSR